MDLNVFLEYLPRYLDFIGFRELLKPFEQGIYSDARHGKITLRNVHNAFLQGVTSVREVAVEAVTGSESSLNENNSSVMEGGQGLDVRVNEVAIVTSKLSTLDDCLLSLSEIGGTQKK